MEAVRSAQRPIVNRSIGQLASNARPLLICKADARLAVEKLVEADSIRAREELQVEVATTRPLVLARHKAFQPRESNKWGLHEVEEPDPQRESR